MTFEQWWEQAEKPFGEARGFKEAALAGWKARQKQDVEICRRKFPWALETAEDCARNIELSE